MNTVSTYWSQRRSSEKLRAARRAESECRRFNNRVAEASVVTLLPNHGEPSEFSRFPVVIYNGNGSRTYCNYLN